MSDAIEKFFTAWGNPDQDARAEELRACLSSKVSYADPRTSRTITDIDTLIAYVAMYTQYAPSATARVTNVSQTEGHYRATVEFRMQDGMTQTGQYFIEADDQSRLRRMVGFVGLGEPE